MADNETIADIIAKMRGMGNYQRYSGDHARVLADRLEAAHKRERGDCVKLREALLQVQKKIKYLIGNLTVPNSLVASRMEINGIINAALAAPPRNCDVGTADEQFERFGPFCNRYDDDCTGCPCDTGSSWNFTNCFARWAQMPNEEGGAK